MKKDVFRKYAVKKLILSLVFVLILAGASESVADEFRAFSGNWGGSVEVNLNHAEEDEASDLLRYSHVVALKERFPEGRVSFSSHLNAYLERGEITLPVKVNLTDESYPEFSGLKMVRGSYFTEKAMELGRNVAVISTDLAERLFMSLNAVGNEITLFDESYVIIGLYEPSKTLRSLMGSDGSDMVYVPFTSYMTCEDLPIETISLHDEELAEAGFRKDMIEDILKKDLGIRTKAYIIIDYYGAETIASQWQSLFQFLIALWTAFLLLGACRRLLQKLRRFVDTGLQQDYLSGFIRKRFGPLIGFVAGLLGLAGLSALLLVYAWPRIYIPSEFLPPDNIFDFKFYWDEIVKAIQASNAMAGYIPTPMEHCFRASSAIGFILLLLEIPAFLSLNAALKLLNGLRHPVRRLAGLFLVSLAVAFIVLLAVSASGLIPLAMSLKSLLLLVLFYFVSILGAERPADAYVRMQRVRESGQLMGVH